MLTPSPTFGSASASSEKRTKPVCPSREDRSVNQPLNAPFASDHSSTICSMLSAAVPVLTRNQSVVRADTPTSVSIRSW